MNVYNQNPALVWAYFAFWLCHSVALRSLYKIAWRPEFTTSRENSKIGETDDEHTPDHRYIQNSIATGFAMGYDLALLVCTILMLVYLWNFAFDVTDVSGILSCLSLEGFLVSLLPAIGALVSVAWSPNPQAAQRACSEKDIADIEGGLFHGKESLPAA